MATDMSTSEPAAPFRTMAELIDLNTGKNFAGAVCIVPPNGEPPLEILLLTQPDLAMFWSMVKTKAEIAMQELANRDAEQRGLGWPIRR